MTFTFGYMRMKDSGRIHLSLTASPFGDTYFGNSSSDFSISFLNPREYTSYWLGTSFVHDILPECSVDAEPKLATWAETEPTVKQRIKLKIGLYRLIIFILIRT